MSRAPVRPWKAPGEFGGPTPWETTVDRPVPCGARSSRAGSSVAVGVAATAGAGPRGPSPRPKSSREVAQPDVAGGELVWLAIPAVGLQWLSFLYMGLRGRRPLWVLSALGYFAPTGPRSPSSRGTRSCGTCSVGCCSPAPGVWDWCTRSWRTRRGCGSRRRSRGRSSLRHRRPRRSNRHRPPPRRRAAGRLRDVVRTANRNGGRLPDGAVPAVREVEDVLKPLLAHVAKRGADVEELHNLEAIVTEYLPGALEHYLDLPEEYALTNRGPGGTTRPRSSSPSCACWSTGRRTCSAPCTTRTRASWPCRAGSSTPSSAAATWTCRDRRQTGGSRTRQGRRPRAPAATQQAPAPAPEVRTDGTLARTTPPPAPYEKREPSVPESDDAKGLSPQAMGLVNALWTAAWIVAFANHVAWLGLAMLFTQGAVMAYVKKEGIPWAGANREALRARRLERHRLRSERHRPPAVETPAPPVLPDPVSTAERALAGAVVRAETSGGRMDAGSVELVREVDRLLRPLLAQLRTREATRRSGTTSRPSRASTCRARSTTTSSCPTTTRTSTGRPPDDAGRRAAQPAAAPRRGVQAAPRRRRPVPRRRPPAAAEPLPRGQVPPQRPGPVSTAWASS